MELARRPKVEQDFDRYNHYPASLSDPYFTALWNRDTGPLARGLIVVDPMTHLPTLSYLDALGFNLAYSVKPVTPPNFELCASVGKFYTYNGTIRSDRQAYCIDNTCVVTTIEPYIPVSFSPVITGPMLAFTAEVTVPFLDAAPALIPQARYAVSQGIVNGDGVRVPAIPYIFNILDKYHDGSVTLAELDANPITGMFSPFYHSGGGVFGDQIDAQIQIRPGDLTEDPAFLFSYGSLRQLTATYTTNSGVGKALSAKLDAAEASENQGNTIAKAGQLNAFRNQLSAQTGKAFTAARAHVLIVLSETL